ncbi:MAG: hypothetical protein AAGC43_04085 [Bacteroidota bacterium]
MKVVIKHIGAFLLIGLLLIKVSAFHVYEHHDEPDEHEHQCELCFLTFISQQVDILVFDTNFIQIGFELPEFTEPINITDLSFPFGFWPSGLLSRPPPFSTSQLIV